MCRTVQIPALIASLSVVCLACGQFRTARFYDEVEMAAEVAGEVAGETAPACDVIVPVEIVTLEIPQGVLGAPYVAALDAVPAAGVDWRVVAGSAPPGLDLDPSTGVLAGVPVVAGIFVFSVEALPQPAQWPCHAATVQAYSLTVTVECDDSADCATEIAAPGVPVECLGDLCLVIKTEGECPLLSEYMGASVLWRAPENLVGREEDGWVVTEHRRLPRAQQEPHEPYDHVLKLAHGTETAELRYSLPEEWPLPYRLGDILGYSFTPAGSKLPSRVAGLWRKSGDAPVLLFDGVLPGPEGEWCKHPLCGFRAQKHPLSCEAEVLPCGCGSVRPDGLTPMDPAYGSALVVSGGSVDLEVAKRQMTWRVGPAYSYTTFNSLLCRGTMPTWASFLLYPRDACPIAVVTPQPAAEASPGSPAPAGYEVGCTLEQGFSSGEVVCYVGDASGPLPHAYFLGTGSFSPGGEEIAEWAWNLTQPVPDLVTLFPTGAAPLAQGASPQKLYPSACGNYRVMLAVKDAAGEKSCIDDMVEVHVRPLPGIDARVELTWRAEQPEHVGKISAELLIKYPEWADSWDDQEWVCSAANPFPTAWSLGQEERLDEVCHLTAGSMEGGWPEVATIRRVRQEEWPEALNPYAVAVRSPASNPGPVLATLRVYLGGNSVPAFERVDRAIEPGLVWVAGGISSKYYSFIPASK